METPPAKALVAAAAVVAMLETVRAWVLVETDLQVALRAQVSAAQRVVAAVLKRHLRAAALVSGVEDFSQAAGRLAPARAPLPTQVAAAVEPEVMTSLSSMEATAVLVSSLSVTESLNF
jgi:hypothetical protein